MTVLMRGDLAGTLRKDRGNKAPLPIPSRLFKELAADDADALSVDDTAPEHPPVICPTCGKVAAPNALKRHMQRTGHGERKESKRVPNENVVANPDGDYSEPLAKAVEDSHVIAMTPEHRHTLVAVSADECGTDPDDFQQHVWDLTKDEGAKVLRDNGGTKLGEAVEYAQWYTGSAPEVLAKDGTGLRRVELPKGTIYVGVKWEPKPWAEFQAGEFSPTAAVRDALTP